MASTAGQTQEQLRSRYGNIPAYNTQADLDYATSRTAPWSHAWGDERGLARIGDSIYQFDNKAGWKRIRTVPQGTFPAAGGGGGGGGSSSLLDALNNALNNQTTGGILSTTGSGTNYTPFGEYLLGPVYSGTSSTDPYVLQGQGQADTLPYVYPQVGGPGAFSVANTYTGANDIASLLADALGINTTTSGTSILDTDTDTETTTTDDDERTYHPGFVVNGEYVGAEGTEGSGHRNLLGAIQLPSGQVISNEAVERTRQGYIDPGIPIGNVLPNVGVAPAGPEYSDQQIAAIAHGGGDAPTVVPTIAPLSTPSVFPGMTGYAPTTPAVTYTGGDPTLGDYMAGLDDETRRNMRSMSIDQIAAQRIAEEEAEREGSGGGGAGALGGYAGDPVGREAAIEARNK